MAERVYLDWNATTPLRLEAREAMLGAMDLAGNPSSVHAEGRAARALVERARAQVAQACGAASADIVFTSGATEAAALGLGSRKDLAVLATEHDAVHAHLGSAGGTEIHVDGNGIARHVPEEGFTCIQSANSETGVIQDAQGRFIDSVQAIGKRPFAFDWSGADMAIVSAHKFGGPKGVGALLMKPGTDLAPLLPGGGQEGGRRAGTENLAGIAGFGAAAEAALRDLEDGVWLPTEKLRNILEEALEAAAPEIIIFGRNVPRLPNTTCFAVPGWKGETQVMQMDLAGYAVSAGSACSSGKVRESRVLKAMGHDATVAQSAIRVSLGPKTTESQVLGFARTWSDHYRRWKRRAA